MKIILSSIFLFLSVIVNAQQAKSLSAYSGNKIIKEGQATIYGNFIQRLGFSSGGLVQEIMIKNVATSEYFRFVVKPMMKSAKENTFCFTILAGDYEIIYYNYNQSTWYGANMFGEPIFKNVISNEDLHLKLQSGALKETDLERFKFTIKENSLNYLGTWHFDDPMVTFSNDKEVLDQKMAKKYKKLDFNSANTSIPN